METIKITMPKCIRPGLVIAIMECNVKENSKFNIKVKQIEGCSLENTYEVSSNDGPDVFYYAGITASVILEKYDLPKQDEISIVVTKLLQYCNRNNISNPLLEMEINGNDKKEHYRLIFERLGL